MEPDNEIRDPRFTSLVDIDGDITIGSIGSGDINVNASGGDLTVRSKGSGKIDHRGVGGRVELPDKR